MHVESLLTERSDESGLAEAVRQYVEGPRPLFTRSPVSYRFVPLGVRMALLRRMAAIRSAPIGDFPDWPMERRIDSALVEPGARLSYGGRPAAVIITHDVDSRPELDMIDRVRSVEAALGVVSAFGFVPRQSWPSEALAKSLVDQGCEVYWHDVAHDGRLPYLGRAGIEAAFDQVERKTPWVRPMMRTFRAGQLLVSAELMEAVSERFDIDMSLPDTERHGPYGGAAGCGTVIPFRYGPLLELPVTLPQEVYLHKVYGYSAEEALGIWLEKLAYIRSVGGVAVFNIHPVWVSSRHQDLFEAFTGFLRAVADQPDLLVTTPQQLAASISVVPADRA